MSSVNYTLGRRGVRLIPAEQAWIKGRNGKLRLNPKYQFVGKNNVTMPNMIVSASDSRKPAYRGDVWGSDLFLVCRRGRYEPYEPCAKR